MTSFTKFPPTPHLVVLKGVTVRGDKVFSIVEREQFLSHEVTVEEKIDGANLGISFGSDGSLRLQNRGSFLVSPMTGQWKTLSEWVAPLTERLFDSLTDRYILFGEWCYATHSIHYERLPDWFIGFDVFDSTERKFLGKPRRDELFSMLEIASVPCLATGHFALDEVVEFSGQSQFGDVRAEGLYLRFDIGKWVGERAKIVRPDFIQSTEQHWSRGPLRKNGLADSRSTSGTRD